MCYGFSISGRLAKVLDALRFDDPASFIRRLPMTSFDSVPQIPSTQQELDNLIQRYRAADPKDGNLYRIWELIRTAALQQKEKEMAG